MIEIEIINACLSVGGKDAAKLLSGIDSYCVVKMFGKEIARTEVATGTLEPIWHEKFPKALHELVHKEVAYNRPFYLESIDLEVYDCSKILGDKHVKIFESRVPISNIGLFKSYKLLRCSGSHDHKESLEENRIFVRIGRVSNLIYDQVENFQFEQLSAICPVHCPLYRHLYMDFSWSSDAFTYSSGLPGPSTGELLVDRYYNVEWRVASGTNIFGDKLTVACTGELLITDLRVIFVPHQIHSPALTWGAEGLFVKDPMHSAENEAQLSPAEVLMVQKYTLQLPLAAIVDCKIFQATGGSAGGNLSATPTSVASAGSGNSSSAHNIPVVPVGFSSTLTSYVTTASPASDSSAAASPWVLCLDGADGSSTEFVVKKQHGVRSQRKMVVAFDRILSMRLKDSRGKLGSPLYRAGLDSDGIDPQVWCERVLDYLQWEIKLDMSWVRWAKYLKQSCKHFSSQAAKAWLKRALSPVDLDVDYQRLRVQDLDWRLSELNATYALCPTYPSVLVFPGAMQDEDIVGAASDRSIGRLPTLVWLHPDTRAPLCRAAQPLSGMSGNSIEQDKRMCVAIKQSCPTGLPLRIADARPKLNANANAVQGKGFENIAFLGGPSVASIVFMDIDNIHVVRHSLAKLRESLHTGGSSGAAETGTGEAADGSTVHASKWTGHISSILRGATGVADSLMLGHPVLVHCSDGWDRTAQLSALAQLMIDPFYRTIEGFLTLLQKEWSAFGHKFEDRLGRRGHSKEVSPVCLQFLDCVWQMQRQFATAFEFSAGFVTLLSQCMYSGLFVNFRRNSERERVQMMRNVGPYEDMQTDDFDYSTLAAYVNLLLRTPGTAARILNGSYVPPKPAQKQVHYLRPSFGLHDLELWKDGLCGLNNNIHATSTMTAPTVTCAEAVAIQADYYTRLLGFVDVHMVHLPAHVQTKLEVLRAAEYPGCTPAPTELSVASAATSPAPAGQQTAPISYATHAESRLLRSVYPHSAVLNPSSTVTRKLASHWRKEDFDADFYDTLDSFKSEEAVSRLQVWARSVLVARRALKIMEAYIEEQGLRPPATAPEQDRLDADGWAVKRRAHLRKSLYASARPRVYFRVFYILAASRARTALRDKQRLQAARAAFVRGIIDDALEQAMIYCIRNDNYQLAYASRRSAVVDSLDGAPFGLSRSSGDYSRNHGADSKRTLSSRFFAGFGGSSKGSEGFPAQATQMAVSTPENSPTRQSSNAGGGNGRSLSPTPKPSLMGRLLGGSTASNTTIQAALPPSSSCSHFRPGKLHRSGTDKMGKGGDKTAAPAEEKPEVLIDGRLYDVTNLKHPGGSVIKFYAGKGIDASQAFYNFHNRSKKARKMMDALPSRPADEKKIQKEALPGQRELLADFDEFTRQLEKEGFFKPSPSHVVFRVLEIVAFYAGGFWCLLNNQIILGLVLLAIGQGRCGWLMHEGGHYSLTGNISIDRTLQIIIYGVGCGMSASWWRNQHNKHHAMPQKLGHDVDLNTLPLVAFTEKVAKRCGLAQKTWIRMQSFLFPTVTTLLVALGWQYYLHIRHILRVKQWGELASIVVRHVVWTAVVTRHFGLYQSALLFLAYDWLASNYIFINFAVSHTHLDVLDKEDRTVDWVRFAAIYTMNVHPGPLWFVSWWMSYLNFQIEHHLFPAMPQFRHPIISPRVKALFEKHGLKYDQRSYVQAMKATFANLDRVGHDVFMG